MLYLIVEEFSEILHIHLAFSCINDRRKCVELCISTLYGGCRADNVGKLTDARRLYNNSVGRIFDKHLCKRLCEVTDEGAANATRIHFGNLNSRILKKSAVNSNFTELIFDKNYLFSCISFL